MKKLLAIIALGVCFGFSDAGAHQLQMELKPEGMYVSDISTDALQQMFADYGYNDYIYMKNWQYPPLFLRQFPYDFAKISDQNLRNRLFLQILTPLALLLNENIALERAEIAAMMQQQNQNLPLSDAQIQRLEALAEQYDVFTRVKAPERYDILLQNLFMKIDVVPPSLLLAVAAAESNWGTAAEVAAGNAIYKTKDWYTGEGIKLTQETDDSYRIKVYDSLYDAMADYALKLNSDVNFENFRLQRSMIKSREKPVRGRVIVSDMVVGSPLENYAGMLSYIIAFYDLINLDDAGLAGIDFFNKEPR